MSLTRVEKKTHNNAVRIMHFFNVSLISEYLNGKRFFFTINIELGFALIRKIKIKTFQSE